MKLLKNKILKYLKKILKNIDIDEDLRKVIAANSYINLQKEFKLLPSINYLLNEEIKKNLEDKINLSINKDGKKFTKIFKHISSEKNIHFQQVFHLNEVDLIIEKTDDGVSLFCDQKNKAKTSFLKSKLLKRIISFKEGALISIDDFKAIYSEIERLKSYGINIIYKGEKSKAKIGIFPDSESFFTQDDIFKRKVIIDDETLDLTLFKDKINGNILFYKDKLIEIDEDFLKEIEKEEELSYIDVVREYIQDTTNMNDKINEFIANKIEFKEIEVPVMKIVTLEEYQKEGVQWLVNNYLNGFGSILADDMGLGKTLQTITTIQYLKNTQQDLKVLIIVPTAVLLNWEYEIESFSELTSSFYYGAGRKIHDTDIVLTTYGTVTYDQLLRDTKWDLIVIDEAQKIKNFDSVIAKKLNEIQSYSKIALTGTPVENNLMDLWSIFNFIIPGYLGSKSDFSSKYKTKDISDQLLVMLKKTIDPFILRRDKSILPLPEKYIEDVIISLEPEQELIYNKIVEDSLKEIEKLSGDENGKRLGIILSTITRLKQACNHPGNYSEEFLNLNSGKLNELKEIINKVRKNKEKIIIFTQYVRMLNILADEFDNTLIFHGGMNVEQRLETLQAFKTDSYDILIISLKAGGTGLNIVEANHVVHYDLWFNPAVENQATDRAHRRGQQKEVFVSRFISKGTFEEKINDMLISKKDLFDKTMNGGNLSYLSKMGDEELRELFLFNG